MLVKVSVPLSGLLFLNKQKNQGTEQLCECFRPLIGVIISKQRAYKLMCTLYEQFPSPYRGYYF